MLQQTVFFSLCIVAIHFCFSEGGVFSFVRIAGANLLDKLGKRTSKIIQKPLWDCLPCMASVWTILLSWSFDILLMLSVCGFNMLIVLFLPESKDQKDLYQ
jgi:hypothetical protein